MKIIKLVITAIMATASGLVPNKASNDTPLPTVLYVDGVNGNNSNNGSADRPFKSIEKALTVAGDLEIHLKGDYTYRVATTYEKTFGLGHDNISIIGEDGLYPKISLGEGCEAYIGTNLTFDYITYTGGTTVSSFTYVLYACGNDLTFGYNCRIDNESFGLPDKYTHGIEYGMNFGVFSGCNGKGGKGVQNSKGEYIKGPSMKGTLKKNSNTLTFLSGDFGKIILSNRIADTGTESNHFKPKVVIGGTAYAYYIGGANDWFNYIDAEITVKENARVHTIVGGILGYIYTESVLEKTYIYNGRTTINVEGGYVKNIIGGSMGRQSAFIKHNADSFINISGGYVESLIGGSAAGNTHGDIHINVSDGTFGIIPDSVARFGVLYNTTELYDTNHETGFYCGGAGTSPFIQTKTNITNEIFSSKGGCYKEDDIVDPSKKVMAMGNTYGNIYANITGGTFNECNIYGGGKGFDHSVTSPAGHENDLFNVAQVSQGVTLNVSGCTVNGNIYGGGAGISGDSDNYYRIGMVAGTIKLTIGDSIEATEPKTEPSNYHTVVNGTVYGGGVNPTVTSLGAKDPVIILNIINTYIYNPDGKIAVHGGSENASVDGDVMIDIKGSCICNDIYLGSGSGNINGSIKIDVLNSTIYGDLTLGSVSGDINGDVTVLVEGISVIQDINIGSDSGTINGKVDVTISSTSVSNDVNIGSGKDKFGNDIEVTINKGSEIGGTVNDNTGDSNLDLDITDTDIKGEMLYVKSFIRAKGNYDNARLEAEHINKPSNKTITYHWHKIDNDKKDTVVYSGPNNYIENLTSEDVGSYYCEAEYVLNDTTRTVKSNTARFAELSDVKAAQVSFDSTPLFNLYVELSSDFNESEKATITVGDRSVSLLGIANNKLGYKTYKFSVALAPYEMASDVSIVIDSENVDAKYSVKQYCKEVLDDDSTPEKMRNLIISLLNYGAASQEYFSYETYNLANSYLGEQDKALSQVIGEEYNKLNIVDNSNDIKAYSATVEILTSTTIRVYFVTKPEGSIDGYKAYINGEEISSDKILYKNSRYYVEITNISAKDLNKEFTVRLEKDDQYVSVTYSVLTYCYSKQNSSNPALRNFALSLYDYYKAVEDYMN